MTSQRQRAREGDLLEIKGSGGYIYIHYIGRHPVYGDAIIVCPVKYERPPDDKTRIFEKGYVTFYPVRAAANQGLARIVGELPSPGLPRRFRRRGMRLGGEVTKWFIVDERGETSKEKLSDEERRLPILSIWNHEFLIERVTHGWRPELEGGPPKRKERRLLTHWLSLFRRSKPTAPLNVFHYLYFPDRETAAPVAAKLRERGFQTDERLGGEEEEKWLLLARHRIVPTEKALAEARDLMEGLADEVDGEYDGWEVEVAE